VACAQYLEGALDLPESLRNVAKEKKQYFPMPPYPEPVAHREFIQAIRSQTDHQRLLSSLEYLLTTFIEPDWDQKFRLEILNYVEKQNTFSKTTHLVVNRILERKSLTSDAEIPIARRILEKLAQILLTLKYRLSYLNSVFHPRIHGFSSQDQTRYKSNP